MWTLIKGSFWFSLVLVLLPVFHSGSSERLANAPPVNFTDAYSVASGAYDYLSNLCTVKPDVCEKGGETFTALGYRAKEGARIAYEYLNERFSDDPAAFAKAGGKPAEAIAAAGEPAAAVSPSGALETAQSIATLAGAWMSPADAATDASAADGAAFQPMPGKPQPYRPPVSDKVVTGTVPAAATGIIAMPDHVPVPLPRPYPEG